MENFKEKAEELLKIKEELDEYIWKIFYAYIKYMKINFNGPEVWNMETNYIEFKGENGCMGCYDKMDLSIPIDFFIDYDKEIEKIEEFKRKEKAESERKKQEAKEKARKAAEVFEREEFERLKAKFGE